MKTIVGKVRRSGIYYLMTTAMPVNEPRNVRFDVFGAVVVLLLLLGLVSLVRLMWTA